MENVTGKTDDQLKKIRAERYPAYVNALADIINVPPYDLMPLWSTISREVEQNEDSYTSPLTTYIKTCKAFRQVLIDNNLISGDAIKRYMDEHPEATQDDTKS